LKKILVLCKLRAACRRHTFYVRANVKERSREYSRQCERGLSENITEAYRVFFNFFDSRVDYLRR